MRNDFLVFLRHHVAWWLLPPLLILGLLGLLVWLSASSDVAGFVYNV